MYNINIYDDDNYVLFVLSRILFFVLYRHNINSRHNINRKVCVIAHFLQECRYTFSFWLSYMLIVLLFYTKL